MASEQRLIDANKLESKLQEHHDFFVDGVGGFRFLSPKDKARVDEITNCIAEVVNSPAVDAVEVTHGRWEHNEYGLQCSKCACDSLYNGFNHPVRSAFCPNCGAVMEDEYNEAID